MRLAEFTARTGWQDVQVQRAVRAGILLANHPGSGNYRSYTDHDVLIARACGAVQRDLMSTRAGANAVRQRRTLRAVADACRNVVDPLEPAEWLVLSFRPARQQWSTDLLDAAADVAAFIQADSDRDYLVIRLSSI